MKKIYLFLATIFIYSFFCHIPAYAEENTFHIDIHYPKKIRVGENASIEVILPPFMPEGSTPTVKIETSTSPQEDFTLIESMPISTLTFKKPGIYAFSVHIGFSLIDL